MFFVLKNSCEWKNETSKTERTCVTHLSLLKMHLKMQGVFYERKAQFKKAGTLPTLDLLFHKLLLKHTVKLLTRDPKKNPPHSQGDKWECKVTRTEIIEPLSGLDHKKTLKTVPLSNDVMCSRIANISFNILKQVIQNTAASPFQWRHFLAFVHCGYADSIKGFLLCKLQRPLTFWKR